MVKLITATYTQYEYTYYGRRSGCSYTFYGYVAVLSMATFYGCSCSAFQYVHGLAY